MSELQCGDSDTAPRTGNIYSFETTPYTEFSPPRTGRYAAFKVLGICDGHLVVATLDGIWSSPPALHLTANCSILEEHRFAHSGRLGVFGMSIDQWQPEDLMSLTSLGVSQCNEVEKELASRVLSKTPGSAFATLDAVNYAAEGEWRWRHDCEALVAEVAQSNAKSAQERAAAERRYRERLSTLTYEQLLSETPLPDWTGAPPYPPAQFTAAARAKIHEATRALMTLGPKPKRASVRKVLKEMVEWFNEADSAAHGVIETEEREDICTALEDLAFVARQRTLVEEINQWRHW